MRIGVNLASEPFRRDRPMIIASRAVAFLLVVSLGAAHVPGNRGT